MPNNDFYFDEDFIRNRIRSLIDDKGVSDREVSLSISKNGSYISNLLSGKNLPSWDMFFALCEYFGISPSEFFNNADDLPIATAQAVGELKRLFGDDFLHLPDLLKKLDTGDIKAIQQTYKALLKINNSSDTN